MIVLIGLGVLVWLLMPRSPGVPFAPQAPVSRFGYNRILNPMTLRGQDTYGSGLYLASRDNGARKHLGADFVTNKGESVLAPFTGKVVRHSKPYSDDNRFDGIEIQNQENFDYVKIFYMSPVGKIGDVVKVGSRVGFAQDLTMKYPNITNHVHVELYNKDSKPLNPERAFV